MRRLCATLHSLAYLLPTYSPFPSLLNLKDYISHHGHNIVSKKNKNHVVGMLMKQGRSILQCSYSVIHRFVLLALRWMYGLHSFNVSVLSWLFTNAALMLGMNGQPRTPAVTPGQLHLTLLITPVCLVTDALPCVLFDYRNCRGMDPDWLVVNTDWMTLNDGWVRLTD